MLSNPRCVTVSMLLLGVGLTACAETDLHPTIAEASEGTSEVSAQLARADLPDGKLVAGMPVVGCSTHAVIGELDGRDGDCSLPGAPSTPNWARHRMFGDSTPDIAAWTEAVPGELQRYCSYEYVGREPIRRAHYDELFAAIDGYSGMSLESVALDGRTEVGQGNGLEDPAVTAQFADAFRRAIQWIPGSALRSTAGAREGVEIAILDTVSRSGLDPVNRHGVAMDAIVGEIACPDGDASCSSTIRHHLAMPRQASSADWARGGEFGTMGDLATAIVAAVGHWRMDRLAAPSAPKRLVINASLGWAPDGTPSNSAPERALEQALEFAACNGALVVAAAGNVANPACTADQAGPLAPASYQLVAAPSPAECEQLGYTAIDSSAFPVFGKTRPLVYAAGGVDGHDRPILNGRPEAMPPLAAYADHVAIASQDGYTTPLTGTSVSTAVVSATASLVWSYAPELTPDQVMQLIYESGVETGRSADFGFVGEQASVHRVSVCAAIETLCSGKDPGQCPVLDCADPATPVDGYLGGYFAAATAAMANADQVRTFVGPAGEDPVCESDRWNEQVKPQPEHPACPSCGLDSPPPPSDASVLSMTLTSQYLGRVEGITLTTFNRPMPPSSYTLGQAVIDSVNDPTVSVTNVTLITGPVSYAYLTFYLDDDTYVGGSIPVE